MKLLENYNTARQKYGEKMVSAMSSEGIPPHYLLSACRFSQGNQIPIERLQQLFRQWMTYVVKNNNIDVNKLSFEQFYQTIQKYKSSYKMPNKIFDNGTIQIGEFKTFKEASLFPVPNNMCICKTNKWFKYYQSPKSRYLLIFDSRRNDSKRYVIAILEHGEVSYADLSGDEFGCSLRDEGKNNKEQKAFNDYQQSIGEDAVHFIYNLTADTSNIIDDNNSIKENRKYETNN